jgi:RNA polymerase sigma-70 factor (ECF subfamily)
MCGLPGPTGEFDLKFLIGEIARGDERAFAAFYDATCSKVHGIACFILKDEALAEEVTMDTFLQVWREAEKYREQQALPLAWLMMIARSRAIDRLRSRNGSRLLFDGIGHDCDFIDPAKQPDECAIADENSERVRACFARLSAIQRELLGLAFFKGLTHHEIARHRNLPLGTVKTHIRKAMALMHALLVESGNPGLPD